jgi:hypothetical protein
LVHYWWVADADAPSQPWSRLMCDREQESKFPEGSTGYMSANWERVTCADCLAARQGLRLTPSRPLLEANPDPNAGLIADWLRRLVAEA